MYLLYFVRKLDKKSLNCYNDHTNKFSQKRGGGSAKELL